MRHRTTAEWIYNDDQCNPATVGWTYKLISHCPAIAGCISNRNRKRNLSYQVHYLHVSFSSEEGLKGLKLWDKFHKLWKTAADTQQTQALIATSLRKLSCASLSNSNSCFTTITSPVTRCTTFKRHSAMDVSTLKWHSVTGIKRHSMSGCAGNTVFNVNVLDI